jgi:hypothetical protein
MSLLAPTLQAFFTDRLMTQTDASPRTIAAYRDTFRLLLAFTARQIGKQPSELDLDDLDAADRRVPQLPPSRPRQHRPDSQRQARRDPLVLPLRGVPAPRTRRDDRARDRDPVQTL